MKKILLKNATFHLDNNERKEYTFSGFIKEDEKKLGYFEEDNTKVTIHILTNDKILVTRVNTQINSKLLFDVKNVTNNEYKLIGFSKSFDILIKTTKLIIKENYIYIEYNIVDDNNIDKKIYELEWRCV